MVTLDDKLVQLVAKWWASSKVETLGAGIHSDGRLFVATPYAGVFIYSHPFDPEKLLKGRKGVMTPTLIQRLVPKDSWPPEHILQPTGALRTCKYGTVCEYQDTKGAMVYLDEKQRKQLLPLRAMNVDLYVHEPGRGCGPVYFVDTSTAELYALCMSVNYKGVMANG